ncbi:efflux RND transporter periplasmic adaptor subunit [Parahaliea mediterranea]|uniref:Efflux RND transporter periplasmic adaptor subunit n=1 Tax=Parahaliea mediterranea TaxID=651086 RepID=A0A939DDY3_9GAMM|nr:efflux RND transporter periplasmic adaptor subunit [Parahaliea mediterranea]MBN7796345.1 efflux RND transporter periplasmic adaptor subunit [Parahaliea mediterranea]
MPTITARSVLKKALPALVVATPLVLATLALLNPPTPERARPDRGPRLTVDTVTVSPTRYAMRISSFGTVQPRTQSTLVSQVGGEVVWVNPQFRDGGVFGAGDALLRIDPRDYEANVQIARASLLEARQVLAEEQAQSQQALADWQRLGDGGEADALVLRKPQLMAAQARVASAEAELRKAELNLERATVTAPFDGRILSTEVDLGEVLGGNTALAEIYATDYVEIRLPLANADLDYVDLPEPRADGGEQQRVPVTIHSSLSAGAAWEGFLVRTEGAIDDSSRQLHVVAQVDDPFQLAGDSGPEHSGRKPLKIGEYVTASIEGRTLPGAVVIANSAIYQGSYVYVVREGLLQRREITIAWQNADSAVIASGLRAGDALVTTPLGQVTSGTPVAVTGERRQVGSGGGARGDSGEARP